MRLRRALAVLFPPRTIIASVLRGLVAAAGFAVLPMAAEMHAYLGKVVNGASLLFSALAVWGLIMPAESAAMLAAADWIKGRARMRTEEADEWTDLHT